jgi:nucleotide-binding universal stress UspA family protein
MHRILAAIDGSDQSYQSIHYVSRMLPSENTEIILFHVKSSISDQFWDLQNEPALRGNVYKIKAWEMHQQAMINEFCKKSKQCLLDAGFAQQAVSVKMQEKIGSIAKDIATESLKGYDAVVVGRKGLNELKNYVMGSVANKLVEILPIPLWIIGGTPRPGKILLCINKADTADAAADHLASMIHNPGTQVTLFHSARTNGTGSDSIFRSFVQNEKNEWVEQSKDKLDDALDAVTPVFDAVKKRLVQGGVEPANIQCRIVNGAQTLASSIISEAERGNYDTIVIGRRNLSKLQNFFARRLSSSIVHMAQHSSAVWIVSSDYRPTIYSRPLGAYMPDARER